MFESIVKNKSLCIPYILSILLTITSIYFFKKQLDSNNLDELIEIYYEIAMLFAKIGSLLFNICCTTFFAYICYINGYFSKFSKRSYKFHTWLTVLTLLIIIFTTIFLLLTSAGNCTNIEVLLSINALQCIIIIVSLWEQRIKFETHIYKMTKESRQAGIPLNFKNAAQLYRITSLQKPSTC